MVAFVINFIALIVVLGILVPVHEFGHFWVARRCGVRVLRFSIGFGRALWRRVGTDGTEWVIAAVPLGGYVRMLDERDHDGSPIDPAELPRAFNRQPVYKRVAIVIAGPLANLLLAVAVFWGLGVVGVMEPRAIVGDPVAQTPAERAGFQAGDIVVAIDGHQVRSWNEMSWLFLQRAVDKARVEVLIERPEGVARTLSLDLRDFSVGDLDANPLPRIGFRPASSQPRIGRLSEGGVAEVAGLRTGDLVVEIDHQAMRSPHDLIEIVRKAPERPLGFVVERDGERMNFTIVPARVRDDAGNEIGRIGAEIGERPPMVKVTYGPIEGIGVAFGKTWDAIVFTLRMMWKMLTLEASIKNLSGPIAIATYAGQAALLGPAQFSELLAVLSIGLGVLNLLPIPVLDGGHLLYLAIEKMRGRPLSDWFVSWGQRVGLLLLVLLTVLVTRNDILRVFF
ncbi:MAG TPA: RIP metalloprotease RseP [Burkholderiaceae bacterium]|nr:RIP metalloprotease RseP [Burkholderiaceae bacterium]